MVYVSKYEHEQQIKKHMLIRVVVLYDYKFYSVLLEQYIFTGKKCCSMKIVLTTPGVFREFRVLNS